MVYQKGCSLRATFLFLAMNPAEAYILDAKEPYRSILLHLQMLIEHVLPTAVMLYKYKIPFYYLDGKQPFCYLNQSKKYVDLVFWHGTHLTKHKQQLVQEKRKHMKSLRYFHLDEIEDKVVIEVLEEAYSLRDLPYHK